MGCRLRVEGENGSIERIRGVDSAPANLGRLCAKGAQLGPTVNTLDRATVPLVRRSPTKFSPVSWNESLDFANRKSLATNHQSTRPDSVAFYGSGQLDSETAYLACKTLQGFLGTNNTDSNSRLCMAAAVAGYRSSLGGDGPPTCYEDIDHADVVLIIGSNLAEAHPVTFDRLRSGKKNRPEQQIIVVDPRRTATCAIADLHIPIAPGSDIAFLNAVARQVIQNGRADEHFIGFHTKGFIEYVAFLMSRPLDEMIALTDVPREQIEQCAKLIGKSKAFLSLYCMGMRARWDVEEQQPHQPALAYGTDRQGLGRAVRRPAERDGRPRMRVALHQLPGYRFVEDARHRTELRVLRRRPQGSMLPKNGLSAIEMSQALERGTRKPFDRAATNPMVSLPDLHSVRRGLEKAELIVVNDAYHPTETTRLADVVFPVASWGEKESTSTNSERMVSRSQKMWNAPGEALPDWQVLCGVAARMGFADSFNYGSNSEVWDEFVRVTKGRPCDMAGITSSRLNDGPVCSGPAPINFTTAPSGAISIALFQPRTARPSSYHAIAERPEVTDDEFPFVLTTGRIYAHWHTLTRTGKAEKLMARDPSPYVEIAFEDADRLKIQDGDEVRLSTRRGEIVLTARREVGMRAGMVFVPFHWGDLFGEGNALNYLTVPAFGPVEKQPELKFCAVNLIKVRHAAVDESRTALTLMET